MPPAFPRPHARPIARAALAILVLLGWRAVVTAQTATTAGAAEAPPPAASGTVRFTVENQQPSLRLWSDTVRIDLHARMQVDVASADHLSNTIDEVDIRQRRLGVSGAVGRVLEFEIEREVYSAKGWRDVFADFRVSSAIRVRGGRFKMPFSMDALTSSAKLDFVTRSLAARWLAPLRDTGVMVHGRKNVFGGPRLGYEIGVFRQGGDGAPLGPLTEGRIARPRGVDRTTVAGRLLVSPFDRPRDRAASSSGPLRSLRIGVAATSGLVPEGDNSLRGQDSFSKPFFPHLDVNGRRTRAGLEASWRGGPATVKAELIHVRDERRGQGPAGADLPALTSTGWYVHGAWTLVRGGKSPSPRGRWLGRGGIGDVEVAARVERIEFGSAAPDGEPLVASPRAANLAGARDTAVTLGVNWQPLPLARIQFNVVRDEVGGTAWTKRHLQPLVWGLLTRFQVAF